MQAETPTITVEDFAYLSHGDTPLTLRLFLPAGKGPFPAIVDIHGGAWNTGDLTDSDARDRFLAEAGFAVAAVDFRHAADGYPTSLIDINYAVRWIKSRAAGFKLDAGRVGLCGQSSGGHLAMLSAMRPGDRRYASLPLDGAEVDASVRCVGMLWPVINPLSRYRNALKQRASDDPPGWIGSIPEKHDIYWGDEAAMEEGNPLLALVRGEPVQLPPAIWIQGRPDGVHDYVDPVHDGDEREPDRFTRLYSEAGGQIELVIIENEDRGQGALEPLLAFYKANL
ncbi:MAG: alpha/beta hydrolase fold domain-containing protein [Alphaproteobacteria bacterium]